jgi:hypothetical protein
MVFLLGHGFTEEIGLKASLEDENFVASMSENRSAQAKFFFSYG